jgi:predicted nucleic acid-binding Zn ribbon protein
MVLRADSTAWATQMKLLLPNLEKRLEEQIGIGRLSEIKILGPAAPSWKHGLRSVPGRGPRDTYG